MEASGVAAIGQRMESLVSEVQDEICAALASFDGATWSEQSWKREGGGGGRSRLLEGGDVIEKAGVNIAAVSGTLAEPAARAMRERRDLPPGRLHFVACGLSVVVHPRNPHVPSVHLNVRTFELHDSTWWFGGGTDLSPSYLYEEDARHFHASLKQACDRHDPEFYPRFKSACDAYFFLPHRGEHRGVGGIFFDDLADRDPAALLAFAGDVARVLVPAYVPIVTRRKDTPFGERERRWQGIRRGRYAEFNLLYDRGTAFGLASGGRPESVLMSLPPAAGWVGFETPEGSREAAMLEVLRRPRGWV